MTLAPSLLAFVAAASLLTITPGLDTALVLRTAALGGSRRAAFAAIGVAAGCLVWGAVAAVGLSALLAASRPAYATLKWVGAAYLIWLGLKSLCRPRSQFKSGPPASLERGSGAAAAFRRGLLTNLLNPKVGVFYVTFLPQFVPAGAPVAVFTFMLACIHVLLGLVWFAALIAAAAPLGRWLSRPRVTKTLDRITGAVFIGFGLRLAFSRGD